MAFDRIKMASLVCMLMMLPWLEGFSIANNGSAAISARSVHSVFPGPPMSLDELWTGSTYVGLVNVTSVKQNENVKQVRVSIKKSLKNPGGHRDTLDVQVILGGCPYPFDFAQGQQVLAFLKYDEQKNLFFPVGAAESAIELDDKTFALYSRRLIELPPILSIADKSEMNRELLQWYINCAAAPEMRHDGAWGISCIRHRKLAKLSKTQSSKIADILLREDPPGQHSAALFAQISDIPNEKIDRYLLAGLRESHSAGWSELTRKAVEHLPTRLGIELHASTSKRLDEYWELFSKVHYSFIDDQDEPRSRPSDKEVAESKERLAILWGAVSNEIYAQCKAAIEARKR